MQSRSQESARSQASTTIQNSALCERSHRFLLLCPISACLVALAGCSAAPSKTAITASRQAAPLTVRWFRPIDHPCIERGAEGEFDSDHLFAPCVIAQPSGGYRMFYPGSGPQKNRLFKIGVADSDDGLTWNKYDNNPVLEFGDGTTSLVTPAILRKEGGEHALDNGKLRMWVIGVDFNVEGHPHKLYETASTDNGMTWEPLTGPLMDDIYSPSIIKHDNTYHMWYVDVSDKPWSFRYAVSNDGTNWTPGYGKPVLQLDQYWENGALFYPYVV